MNRSLHEHAASLAALLDQLECSDDDEERNAARAWLLDEREAFSAKVDRVLAYIEERRAMARARAESAKRMSELAKRDERAAERCEAMLFDALESLGIERMETERFSVGIAQTGGKRAVLVDDVDALPRHLLRHVPETYEPDRRAIGALLEAGEDVPGARLEARKRVLRWR